MTANNLGPQFEGLFHGTAADLHPGDQVLPAAVHGQGSHWAAWGYRTRGGLGVKRFAFATTDEQQAWNFAEYAQQENNGRSSVLRVGHHPEEQQGLYHEARAGKKRTVIPGETIAPSFPVEERIDIMPGMQGTFPEINWQRHSKHPDVASLGDAYNHPTDGQITEGHGGGEFHKGNLKRIFGDWEAPPEPTHEEKHRGQGRLW